MVRICDGDVSVRRTVSSSRKRVWSGDRVGWPGGKLSPSKLYRVVSTSRPSTTVYPRPRKMSSTSRRICVMRWSCPRGTGVPGIVTSIRSSVSRRSRSARRSSSSRPSIAVSRRSRRRVQRHPRLAVADVAERELELALAAEVLDPDLLDVVRRGCGLESRESLGLERLRIHGGDCIGIRLVSLLHGFLLSRAVGTGRAPGGTRRNGVRLGARRCPGSEPGLRKERRAKRDHVLAG